MKYPKTPSFILELPLRTTPTDESTILVRLDTGRQLYNACVGEGLRCLALIQQSKDFQEIMKLPKTVDGKPNKERTKAFNVLNKKEKFREYDLHHYVAGIRVGWLREHIDINTAQKIATRAFKAAQKKAFGIAKNVRFKGKNQFDSLEGKDNQMGLIFRNNVLYWSGLEPVLSVAVSRARQTAIGKATPTSFGFNGTQSQSSSLVKPATIVSEAMDVVLHHGMDESHRELV